MLTDNMTVKGRLHCILTGPDGTVLREWEQDNVVTNAGKAWIASRMAGTSSAVMSHMAVGTGAAAAAAADTALASEVATTGRKALTSTTPSNNTVVYSATFAAGEATGTLAEAGLFNASPGGTMLARTNISVTKGAADSLTINWTITVG